MLDFTQTIEQAEKLGFEYFTDESVDYFDFHDCVSSPFSDYIYSLSGFQVLTSTVKRNLSRENENIKREYDKTQRKGGYYIPHKETGELGEPLSAEDAEAFKQVLGNVLSSMEIAREVYLSMYVITLVSKFEAYLQNIVTEIAKHYPVTMKSGKTVSVSDILQFDEMSSLIEYLAENSSLKITEGTVTEYINGIGSKFGIPISQFKDLIYEVEYFVDIRHIQVHRNGIIDSSFHRKYRNAGDLGKPIKLDFDLLAQMSRTFRLFANLIEVMLLEKFPKIARVSVSAIFDEDGTVDDIFLKLETICLAERKSFKE